MGFITAFAGALGGTLADQWKDFLTPPRDCRQRRSFPVWLEPNNRQVSGSTNALFALTGAAGSNVQQMLGQLGRFHL